MEESAQQALQVIDTGQTLDLRHHGACVRAWGGTPPRIAAWCSQRPEAMAAWVIGRYPSDGSVVAFKGAEMLLHLGVTALLQREGWQRACAVWEGVTIAVQGGVDAHNAEIGLQIHF